MIIKTNFNSGGRAMHPARGRADGGTDNLTRALRDICDDLARVFNAGASATLRSGGIAPLGLVVAPSTPSAQLTGTGNTTFNVQAAAHQCTVGGVKKTFAAQDDIDVHSGSYIAGFANGSSVIAAIVNQNNAGTVTTVTVLGTPATSGSEVAPTDAEIQAAIGATFPWVKVGETTLARTGDTTVAQTYDNVVAETYLHRSTTEALETVKG
jgi:hypothetical protein